MPIVFVYGSLKKGFHNHPLLCDSKMVGIDRIQGRMFSMGHFPCVVPGIIKKPMRGNGIIHGEVYEVDGKTMEGLDRLEGHPVFFARSRIRTMGGKSCWTYFFQGDTDKLRQIRDGIWRDVAVVVAAPTR